jgi:hypothetical protein
MANDINAKTWRTSFSLSEFSKSIVTSIVNANVAVSSSDAVDKIISNWATKSDTGRDIVEKVKNVETIKW